MDSMQEDSPVDYVCSTSGSAFFDEAIGHIEDIALSEEFRKYHEAFLDKHWKTFDDKEENKLEYTDIFEEYTKKFENYFMDRLHNRMDNFDMEKFATELNSFDATKEDPYNFKGSEIFELLHTFNNFQSFKELMLDYRRQKEGLTSHLDADILITTPLR